MAIRADGIKFINSTLGGIHAKANEDREEVTNPFDKQILYDMGNTYIRNDALDYLHKYHNMKFTIEHTDGKKYEFSEYKKLDKRLRPQLPARHYFANLGFEYKCIDLNEEDGAIAVDLRQPIIENDMYNLINTADVIIDSGTSEHIEYQYMNFKNLYDMLKVGGTIIHILPKVGYWENHCQYKYDTQFFAQLAANNDYELVTVDNRYPEKNIRVVITKTGNNGFMSEHQFNKLSLHTCKAEGSYIDEDGKEWPNVLTNDRALYPWAYLRSTGDSGYINHAHDAVNIKGKMHKVDINKIKEDVKNNEVGKRPLDEWLVEIDE